MHLTFRFAPESEPGSRRKLKVEINTREHDRVPRAPIPVWRRVRLVPGRAEIVSFDPEELFGTKLRALRQRRKDRDLFDLNEGLKQSSMDPAKLIRCFEHYLSLEGVTIGRAAAEQRLLERLEFSLTEDVVPSAARITFDDDEAVAAVGRVWAELVPRLHGEPWKLSDEYIEAVRAER